MTALVLLAFAAAPAVSLIDDFETRDSLWQGRFQITAEAASHGRQSARVTFSRGAAGVSTTKVPADWSPYDRLLFDVRSSREEVATLSVRIWDDRHDASRPYDYFEARQKVMVLAGWNHAEIRLPLQAASFERPINLKAVRRIAVLAEGAGLPWTVDLDNFRLVAGPESAASASRTAPQDTVSVIDNRWVQVRQVARPEDVPEADDVKQLRREAGREEELLVRAIRAAEVQGIPTIYAERRLVTADIGLRVRPLLAWFNNDEAKRRLFRFVARSCRESRRELEDLQTGTTRLPHTDDTQVAGPLIRPLPPLGGRPKAGWFFRDERGEPMMVLSLHSPSRLLQRFFATPLQHVESYSVGGGSRWTILDSPVYAAFKKHQDARRVGWDGWCGHLVQDIHSMGGSSKENIVICLESPHIREAVEEYIRINTPRLASPELLYNILAYELMYICYCDRSKRMFHAWLEKKHGTVQAANDCWGTSYGAFSDVVPPPVKDSRPLAGTNRGLWYDWARFNQDRFTDYLLWVRGVVRKVDPATPLAAGGSSSMLAGRKGTTGIDEERIVNEVGDIIIHEGGGSTLGMDLQLSLAEERKPLADPEMSLGSVEFLLPHFLHGKSVAQLYHWPAQPAEEYLSNTRHSLAHGWDYALEDVDELLRTALDLRRLNREIAAFVDSPAEVAILYSETSTLQLPPEMLTWQTTPYLAELEKTYRAALNLDARITFITERQIGKGWLSRYKLLIVPAVRNLPAGVVDAIYKWTSGGGHAFVVPESLLGDEYNRPGDYLARLDIKIEGTERPKPGLGSRVQGYDQSFSEQVTFSDVRGIRQVIRTSAAPLERYPDGSPSLVRITPGQGWIMYSAVSPEPETYSALLDRAFREAGVSRPLRAGNRKLEFRTARLGRRRLFYAINYGGAPVEASLNTEVRGLRELRTGRETAGGRFSVPAHRTAIFEIME